MLRMRLTEGFEEIDDLFQILVGGGVHEVG